MNIWWPAVKFDLPFHNMEFHDGFIFCREILQGIASSFPGCIPISPGPVYFRLIGTQIILPSDSMGMLEILPFEKNFGAILNWKQNTLPRSPNNQLLRECLDVVFKKAIEIHFGNDRAKWPYLSMELESSFCDAVLQVPTETRTIQDLIYQYRKDVLRHIMEAFPTNSIATGTTTTTEAPSTVNTTTFNSGTS